MKLRDNTGIESASCYVHICTENSGVQMGLAVAFQTGSMWLWDTNNADYGRGVSFQTTSAC